MFPLSGDKEGGYQEKITQPREIFIRNLIFELQHQLQQKGARNGRNIAGVLSEGGLTSHRHQEQFVDRPSSKKLGRKLDEAKFDMSNFKN